MSSCRVGASLTGGSPPGTVHAPLDAYGSTSETAEGHILQRGPGVVPTVPRVQRDVRPPQHQAEVPPIVVATHPLGRDVVDVHQRQILQRQSGDGGDVLEAIKDESGVWTPVIRLCDAFGLDLKAQHGKLKKKHWAIMALKAMIGPDWKLRQTLCIHLDALPMWLAGIESSRVKVEVRPRLDLYQLECARILSDYFYGVRTPSTTTAPTTQTDRMLEAISNGYLAFNRLREDFDGVRAQLEAG